MTAKIHNILIANGPNLNLLGEREPEVYGRLTLAELDSACVQQAQELGLTVECQQTNSEGTLIDLVQRARKSHDALIINPGGYTHTSVALSDAVLAFAKPVIEVHLSNIHGRESYRRHSYISPFAVGVICGLGAQGYLLALRALASMEI